MILLFFTQVEGGLPHSLLQLPGAQTAAMNTSTTKFLVPVCLSEEGSRKPVSLFAAERGWNISMPRWLGAGTRVHGTVSSDE